MTDTITIAAIGDFMISRRFAPDDVNAVGELLAGNDLVIANVDTVLSDQGTPVPKWVNLRGPREAAGDLRAMGIAIVTMANNHAMDFRAPGMLDTCRAYDEAGILHPGAGANLAAATAPAVIEVHGRTVSVLSVACTLPVESAAGLDWPGIAPLHVRYAFTIDESLFAEQPGSVPEIKTWLDETELARVCADVAAARSNADIVLPVVHWGVPPLWRAPAHPIVQEHQRTLGRALIDAGADAVIGNHAHELHGIEFYQDKPIAYCLGNFWIDTIGDYDWLAHESMVLRLTFGAAREPDVDIVPLFLDEGGVPRVDESARSVAVLDRLSREFGVAVAMNETSNTANACRLPS